MKGKQHLAISIMILFTIFVVFLFYAPDNMSIPTLLLLFCLFLFVIGSILPDSDSKNKGSMIYVLVPIARKKIRRNKYNKKKDDLEDIGRIMLFAFGIVAYPMGWITNQLEKLIMKYTNRVRGHRQSLHTVSGILIVSIFWSIIFYFIYSSISNSYSLLSLILFFVVLFISQFLHLLEDMTQGLQIEWK